MVSAMGEVTLLAGGLLVLSVAFAGVAGLMFSLVPGVPSVWWGLLGAAGVVLLAISIFTAWLAFRGLKEALW